MTLIESDSPLSPGFTEQINTHEARQPTEAIIREIVETLLLTFFIFFIVNSIPITTST